MDSLSLFPRKPNDSSQHSALPVEAEKPGCLVQTLAGLAVSAFIVPGAEFVERLITAAVLLLIANVIDRAQRGSVQRSRDIVAAEVLSKIRKGLHVSPFNLYFRPFEVTNRIRIRNMRRERFLVTDSQRLVEPATRDLETLLARAMWVRRPLVALGRPGETLGAGRIDTDDELWRADVTCLLEAAELVFVIPGTRSGIKWEMELIRDKNYISKCIFIMPPEPQGRISVRFAEEMWNKAITELRNIGYDLPDYRADGLLFTFNSDGKVAYTSPFHAESLESTILRLRQN